MKRSIKNFVLIFILVFGFSGNSDSQSAVKTNVSGPLYFPAQLPDEKDLINDKMDDFRNKWYSRHLASLKEPILFNKTGDNFHVFRYTNLGTFSNPFCIRVELNDSIVTINYKQTDGKGGYGTGKLIEDIHKQLTIEDWKSLLAKVESTRFWDMATYRRFIENGTETVTLDGTEWIFEGLIGGKYHIVTRNTPESNDDKDYASLCNLMYDFYSVIKK
jgi:hypothetical protein